MTAPDIRIGSTMADHPLTLVREVPGSIEGRDPTAADATERSVNGLATARKAQLGLGPGKNFVE